MAPSPALAAPLPIPPAALAAAAARWADSLATVLGTHKAGAPRSVIDSMMPALWASAVNYSFVAGALVAMDNSPVTRRWSAIADGALWTAIHLGAKGS
jgi:hypothetical protein